MCRHGFIVLIEIIVMPFAPVTNITGVLALLLMKKLPTVNVRLVCNIHFTYLDNKIRLISVYIYENCIIISCHFLSNTFLSAVLSMMNR